MGCLLHRHLYLVLVHWCMGIRRFLQLFDLTLSTCGHFVRMHSVFPLLLLYLLSHSLNSSFCYLHLLLVLFLYSLLLIHVLAGLHPLLDLGELF